MDFLLQMFKALSNETRMRIIGFLIQNRESSLAALVLGLKLPYKTVDRNLKILEQAKLVMSRRWKGLVYYSLGDSGELKYNQIIFKLIKTHMESRE